MHPLGGGISIDGPGFGKRDRMRGGGGAGLMMASEVCHGPPALRITGLSAVGGRCGIWGAKRLMCRNIKTLHNFKPPATDDEIRASSLQFVRKLSGFTRPSKANQPAFDRAVDQVANAARELLASLVTNASPRDREIEASKARARAADRFLSPT